MWVVLRHNCEFKTPPNGLQHQPPTSKGQWCQNDWKENIYRTLVLGLLPPQLHFKRAMLPKLFKTIYIQCLVMKLLTPLVLMFCSLCDLFVGTEYIVLIYWLWHIVGSWKLISLYQSCHNYHAVNIATLGIIVFTFICLNFIFTFLWYQFNKVALIIMRLTLPSWA